MHLEHERKRTLKSISNEQGTVLKTSASRLDVIHVFYEAGILVAYSIHFE